MTKTRAPVTFENALARIAGHVGWEAMATAIGRKERMLRYYGEPDSPFTVTIDDALTLDVLFMRHGGEGSPMHETYGLMLAARVTDEFADSAALGRLTVDVIREVSEAEAALVTAQLHGATDQDRADAARETEEAIAALKRTLPLLTKGTGPNGIIGEGKAPGGAE